MAGSSHTLTSRKNIGGLLEIVTNFVGDDTDGTIPTLDIAFPYDVQLEELEFVVGATPPTASADLTAVDAYGVDRFFGAGTNVISTASSDNSIVFASTEIHPMLAAGETLTLTIANTSAVDSLGTIIIRALRIADAGGSN